MEEKKIQICDCCHKQPAQIYVKGEGKYCVDCYNSTFADLYNWDNDAFQYTRDIAVTDKAGDLHYFHLSHLFFGNMVRWEAVEHGGSYEIVMRGTQITPAKVQIQEFHRKIAETLWNRTTEKNDTSLPEYSLKDHGNIDIRYSEEENGIIFVIDGRKFSPAEFSSMLEEYEGWTIQYQIRDKGRDILKEKEMLIPVEMTKKALVSELESAIFSFSKSKYIDDIQFVSYKNTSSLFDYIIRVIDKLEYMWEDGRREEAEETGKEMIRILQAVETDDDQFPEYEISLIENIIYPYGQS